MKPLAGGRRTSRRPAAHEAGQPSIALQATRVAIAAAAIVGVVYAVIAFAVVMLVSARMMGDIDTRLADAMLGAHHQYGNPPIPFDAGRQDPRGLPILQWRVMEDGSVQYDGPNGLLQVSLPAAYRNVDAPTTVTLDGVQYRLRGMDILYGNAFGGPEAAHLIVGQSLDSYSSSLSGLIAAAVGIGLALLAFVLLGSLAIGWRVASPIERARQRQLEFTADASHELRTPLSVVEAQTSLALARRRESAWDANAFRRIDSELLRMRRLLDDMLWLARFDSAVEPPASEPVDLAVLAAQTTDRFGAVAEARRQTLTVDPAEAGQSLVVSAPPEWLDRLVGVLLDNACKYSPEGGTVAVSVTGDGRRVRLTVDDSGPGIPEAERDRIFDRFHRATDAPGGAGLGLAIADSIVKATNGHWTIGTSPAGGASISVSWPRSMTGPKGRESHAPESAGDSASA